MKKHTLGILFSGSGSTAEAIAKAVLSNQYPNTGIGCAISSSPEAKGVQKLQALGVLVYIVEPKNFKNEENKVDRHAFGEAILKLLSKHEVTVVTQNGWIPLTPRNVVEAYTGNIFNQHPGPVPEFGGKGMMGIIVHEAILRFQEKTGRQFPTEMVAHRVTSGLDEGAIVRKIEVPILPDDTAESLQQRALPREHDNQLLLLEDIDQGNVHDVPTRKEALVKPGEEKLLEEAKKEAIEKYSDHK